MYTRNEFWQLYHVSQLNEFIGGRIIKQSVYEYFRELMTGWVVSVQELDNGWFLVNFEEIE